MADRVACLHVCITCRAGMALEAGGEPVGAALHRALSALLEGEPAIAVRPVECLTACARGCTAVISAPGKWSYLLGGLWPWQAADVADYARSYARSGTGTIMPSRRAESLKDMILGRFPAHDIAMREAAE